MNSSQFLILLLVPLLMACGRNELDDRLASGDHVAITLKPESTMRVDCEDNSPMVTTFPAGEIFSRIDASRSLKDWSYVKTIKFVGCLSPKDAYKTEKTISLKEYKGVNVAKSLITKTNTDLLFETGGRLGKENEKILLTLLGNKTKKIHYKTSSILLGDKIIEENARAAAMKALARLYARTNRKKEAANLYFKLAQEVPWEKWEPSKLSRLRTGVMARLEGAKILRTVSGTEKETVDIFMELIAKYPNVKIKWDEKDSEVDREAYNNLIKLMSSKELKGQKYEVINKVLKTSQNSSLRAQALIQRALWYEKEKKFDLFKNDLRQAIKEKNTSWTFFETFGHFGAAALHHLTLFYEKLGQIDEAMEMLDLYILDANSVEEIQIVSYYHRGRLWMKREDFRTARPDFEEVLRLLEKRKLVNGLSVSFKAGKLAKPVISKKAIEALLNG